MKLVPLTDIQMNSKIQKTNEFPEFENILNNPGIDAPNKLKLYNWYIQMINRNKYNHITKNNQLIDSSTQTENLNIDVGTTTENSNIEEGNRIINSEEIQSPEVPMISTRDQASQARVDIPIMDQEVQVNLPIYTINQQLLYNIIRRYYNINDKNEIVHQVTRRVIRNSDINLILHYLTENLRQPNRRPNGVNDVIRTLKIDPNFNVRLINNDDVRIEFPAPTTRVKYLVNLSNSNKKQEGKVVAAFDQSSFQKSFPSWKV